jgi:3-hydroxyisobutyrate dehydrogenase
MSNNGPQSIAFIGAGGIGRPMAERLIASGYKVKVCDRSESVRAAFHAAGVSTSIYPSDCIDSDVIIIMVANDAQLREVISAPKGILDSAETAHPPFTIIMSTVLPRTIREASVLLGNKGIRVVEAPVSGGAVKATNGALTIMTGGETGDIQAVEHVLAALGNNRFHCGPLGSAATVKILNNIVGLTNTFLMTEVSRMALALGVDLAWLASVMESSSGRNWATRDYEEQRKFYRVTGKDLPTLKAIVDVCRKDFELGCSLARELEVLTPILDAVSQANRKVPYEVLLGNWQLLQ